MRILNVIGSVDPRNGGTTDHVFSSSEVWSRHGHECHVLCLDPPDSACVVRSPLVTFALGEKGRYLESARRLFPFLRYGYTPRLGNWLRRNAKNYDAIILNGLWNYTSFGSWIALRMSDVPYYLCPHGMLDPWLKEAHPVKHSLRTIFWNLFEKRVFRDARDILFASEEEKQLANRSFLQGSSRGHVLGYGTRDVPDEAEIQKATFQTKYDRMRGRKLILFLSRIHPKKGLDLLIRAFARHAGEFAEFDLVIAGPDDVGTKSRLVKISAELGVDTRIHWTGMLTGDAKWGAFRSATFFVLPSHQENFGIAVVEALACSVPVLVTKKVNIWQEVESSGAGHAVSDTVEGIADGLHHMCSLSRPQRDLMAANARFCFSGRFDLEKNAMELIDLMASLNRHSGESVYRHRMG